MKPKDKGWLQEYLEFRKDLFKDISDRKASHPDYALYKIMQPTGLMYGQTVGDINYPTIGEWDEKDKLKILLAESLISSSLLYQNKPIHTPEELSEAFVDSLGNIGKFYNSIFPELATPAKTLFGRKKSPLELAEKILDKRIERYAQHKENFWASFFHNSLLFLDVFIFGQWMHTNADRIVTDFFRYEREELRFSVIKVIAAAAHSDNEINYEEQRLLEYFIQGTDLPPARKKEALAIFDKGVTIEEINLPSENSWILKKFFLEVAILTTWADRKVEQAEHDFLKRFCEYLGFTEDDLENSMMAIEGFVLEHWQQLEYLQNKQDYTRLTEHYIARVAKVAEKNKGRILKEIQASRAVSGLLEKARTQELTPEESEQVRLALIQMLKTVPTFVIISLPQRFLTLPILMKILPKNIFS
jgi:tellurite resistance protein